MRLMEIRLMLRASWEDQNDAEGRSEEGFRMRLTVGIRMRLRGVWNHNEADGWNQNEVEKGVIRMRLTVGMRTRLPLQATQ